MVCTKFGMVLLHLVLPEEAGCYYFYFRFCGNDRGIILWGNNYSLHLRCFVISIVITTASSSTRRVVQIEMRFTTISYELENKNNDNRIKLNLNHATTTATTITVLPKFVSAKRCRHSQKNTARGGEGMPPLRIKLRLSRSGKSNASP